MTPADSRDVAAFVNAGSARTSERVEFWLSVGLVMAVGLVAGVLICLWGQGCEPGHLCSVGAMLATAADSDGPWALRGRLTGIALDRLQAEREAAAMPLPDLLLATGAMTGPYRRTRPIFARGLAFDALRCAVAGRWRAARMYLATALACRGRAPF